MMLQAEIQYFLNKLDDNIKKIIKNQVKEQVKAQVSKILAKIKKTVNEQLEAEIMTHSSTKSKTSLALAANLSELELKKILIEKMEGNKSIHRSNEQKNLYKALVEAYESDKLILDTYDDTVSFKRRRDDEDKDEEPFAGSNWGDDDKLYTFKEGDFKRLRLQDIEDMLILLVQGKLTNLNVEDRLAFGVSLRMFTRSIIIQRRVEDLQLGIESYQKKLNITKPDTYRSDLKRRDAYTAYSNPRGFIYQNKDKKNKLMRIDELHKFSDGTLDDVRTALNDRLKGIRMEYLPKTIWRQSDRERAKAMIQAIDKQLKSRRIMRSLEKFVGGRPYEGRSSWIRRILKDRGEGQPKLGLWYPKDSPFDLVAYTDSDYAGASLDRKSTTGGCQSLGSRLISWQCKKQTVVANSKTEAEYVAASSCCGQMLWIQNQLLDYGDCNEKTLIQMVKIHIDKNVVDLLTKAFDLQAPVDGKKVIITKSTVRRDLHLEDTEGVDCLSNAIIFEQLTLMGAKITAWNEFSSTMDSVIICLATDQKFNFSKYIFKSKVKNLDMKYNDYGKDFMEVFWPYDGSIEDLDVLLIDLEVDFTDCFGTAGNQSQRLGAWDEEEEVALKNEFC
ncbi:hypothetical protein Tco_1362175 [Tanacetum coccineum]